MKKAVVVILVLVAVAGALLYFVIPNTIRVQQGSTIPVNARSFSRIILDDKKWAGWWPGGVLPAAGKGYAGYEFNGHTYRIVEKKLSSLTILIDSGQQSFRTELLFIPLNPDSVALNWEGDHAAPSAPAERLKFYYGVKAINNDLKTILEKMKNFYAVKANVYGVLIQNTLVTDSALISTAITTNGYPSIAAVYELVNRLQAFAAKNNARQTAPPMLNINTADSIIYTIRVALPVDKRLKDEGAIAYRWMMGGGHILTADVKGGPHTIQNTFTEMEHYINDFRYTNAAIPFQSLLTDRSIEPDTAKWVTKLYWPVM